MANKIDITLGGVVSYPRTIEEQVEDRSGVKLNTKLAQIAADATEAKDTAAAVNRGEQILAWDGDSLPVVANIPAGVSVTYDSTSYTGTLAASASTKDKVYLVSDGNGNATRYVTSQSGSTYSWVSIGSTEMKLAGYATVSDVSQLSQKVDEKFTLFQEEISPAYAQTFYLGRRIDQDGSFTETLNYRATDFIAVNSGDIITYSGQVTSPYICVAGYSNNEGAGFVEMLKGTSSQVNDIKLRVPDGVKYIVACGTLASNKSLIVEPFNIEQRVNKIEQDFTQTLFPVRKTSLSLTDASTAIWANFSPIGAHKYVIESSDVPSEIKLYSDYGASSALIRTLDLSNVHSTGLNKYEFDITLQDIAGGAKWMRLNIHAAGTSVYVLDSDGRLSKTEERIGDLSDEIDGTSSNQQDYTAAGNGFVWQRSHIIESNANSEYYVIPNKEYDIVSATLFANNTGYILVAFYSTETISAEGFISGINEDGNASSGQNIIAEVPSECKIIVISNRVVLGDATFTLERKGFNRKLVEIESQTAGSTNPFAGKNVAVLGDSISASQTNPFLTILPGDVGVEVQAYISWPDVYSDSDGEAPTGKTIGGVSLTAQMIGTLQSFVPVLEDVGKTVGAGLNAYSDDFPSWFKLVAKRLGCNIINASYSGASMCSGQSRATENNSFAWADYTIGRCKTRDGDGNDITPDYIIVYRGVNDMSQQQGNSFSLLTPYDINVNGYPNTDNDGEGNYYFEKAYYLTIKKLRNRFPFAKIYVCTLNWFNRFPDNTGFPTRNGIYTLPQINDTIRKIGDIMGCGLIEFDKDGITMENAYPTYISESATIPTHPNEAGHAVMAEQAIKGLMNS